MNGFGWASVINDVFNLYNSSMSARYSAKSQKSSLKYQAEMSAINARLAELSARSTLDADKVEAAQTGLQYGALKSRQRASLAANGVDLGVGNAAEIQASTDILKRIDLNHVKANALRSAFGIRTQGLNALADSRMTSASAAGISPSAAGISTLLTGAGQVAGRWYQAGYLDFLK